MTIETIIVEGVGVLGFLTNVWANLLIARKHESGWTIRLLANVLWLAFGFAAMSFANILSSVVFAGINVYGWRRWRRERLAGPPRCSECAAREQRELEVARMLVASREPVVADDAETVAALEHVRAKIAQARDSLPAPRSVVGEIDDAI